MYANQGFGSGAWLQNGKVLGPPILPDLHWSPYIKNGQPCCNVNAYMCMLCKQIDFNCPCCYYVGYNMMFML
jgi:hypothetical protein